MDENGGRGGRECVQTSILDEFHLRDPANARPACPFTPSRRRKKKSTVVNNVNVHKE